MVPAKKRIQNPARRSGRAAHSSVFGISICSLWDRFLSRAAVRAPWTFYFFRGEQGLLFRLAAPLRAEISRTSTFCEAGVGLAIRVV